jgi:hypothetical protein
MSRRLEEFPQCFNVKLVMAIANVNLAPLHLSNIRIELAILRDELQRSATDFELLPQLGNF